MFYTTVLFFVKATCYFNTIIPQIRGIKLKQGDLVFNQLSLVALLCRIFIEYLVWWRSRLQPGQQQKEPWLGVLNLVCLVWLSLVLSHPTCLCRCPVPPAPQPILTLLVVTIHVITVPSAAQETGQKQLICPEPLGGLHAAFFALLLMLLMFGPECTLQNQCKLMYVCAQTAGVDTIPCTSVQLSRSPGGERVPACFLKPQLMMSYNQVLLNRHIVPQIHFKAVVLDFRSQDCVSASFKYVFVTVSG